VYPALHRLEGAGLLGSGWEVVSGRRRRIYQLTPAGELAMADQARQWREFSGSMARVLGTAAGALTRRPTLHAGTAGMGATA
jgi:DNA-binding PadR family transcriptional regulator